MFCLVIEGYEHFSELAVISLIPQIFFFSLIAPVNDAWINLFIFSMITKAQFFSHITYTDLFLIFGWRFWTCNYTQKKLLSFFQLILTSYYWYMIQFMCKEKKFYFVFSCVSVCRLSVQIHQSAPEAHRHTHGWWPGMNLETKNKTEQEETTHKRYNNLYT